MSFSLFNDIKRKIYANQLQGDQTTAVFGDIKLDLTQSPLIPGDHRMQVQTVFGDVKIRVPEHVGIDIDVTTIFGEVEIENLSTGDDEKPGAGWTSPNYLNAEIRLNIRVLGIFGDIDIIRVPSPHQPHIVEGTRVDDLQSLPDKGGQSDFPFDRSFEGQTTRLPRD
jgi:predicted membrane protein